ncbi:MAG: hypothetical protein ABIP95_05970 [Pelobium sp.]
MDKYNFNPLGLQQLLAALYALDEEALDAEASALENDFTGWCMQHFLLDATQLAYLTGMAPQMRDQLSQRGSHFLRNRWPINLIQGATAPLLKGDGDSAKIFNLEEQQQSTYSPNTSYQSSSVLNIQITYPAS